MIEREVDGKLLGTANCVKCAPGSKPSLDRTQCEPCLYYPIIGKKHAFKKYDQFALNTGCFWGSNGSTVTSLEQNSQKFCYKKKSINKLIVIVKAKFS